MASLGVNTLQTRCNNVCPITLQDTSKAGDKAIRMTDGQCYMIYAISNHIKRLIRAGMNVGHPNFVLPTRVPITVTDLNMLHINPAEIRAMGVAYRPPSPPGVPPRPFDPNRLYIPDNHRFGAESDDDAMALRKRKPTRKRKPSKRKPTKRVRKMKRK